MQRIEDDDQLSEMYGHFFGHDGQPSPAEPIPIAKLVQLFRSNDPRIRSRVARIVGKYSNYQAFVAQRLQESDPRVRANAIESLWGVDTPVVRRYLASAVADGHHRARINAIYGLYTLGDASAIRLLIKEARHSSAAFRAAAVWGMGQAADPRFCGILKEMTADSDDAVKRVAGLSLARMEERMAAERQKPRIPARILRARGPDSEWRSLTMTLPEEIAHSVKTTDFIIEEDGEAIFNFEIDHVTAARPIRLGIALPEARAGSTWVASVEAVLKNWLAAAGRQDSFAIMRYSNDEARLSYTSQGLRAVYENRPERVAAQLANLAPVGELHQTVTELANGLFGPDRALVIIAETESSGGNAAMFCPSPHLTAVIRARHVPVHIIASADGEKKPLSSAAAMLGGVFLSGATTEAVIEACMALFNSFRNRFEIRYLPEQKIENPARVKITLFTGQGWIEETADLL